MANGNTVTVVGNLTRDPELRYTPSGASNTRFGVAVNRRWMDRNTNEWQEATSHDGTRREGRTGDAAIVNLTRADC